MRITPENSDCFTDPTYDFGEDAYVIATELAAEVAAEAGQATWIPVPVWVGPPPVGFDDEGEF